MYCVFNIFLLIYYVYADRLNTDNPLIHFKYGNNTPGAIFTAVKDQPLYIILEDYNASYVSCYDYNYKLRLSYFVNYVTPNDTATGNQEVLVPSVKNKMDAYWKCLVLTTCNSCKYTYLGKPYDPHQLSFNLHVKGAKHPTLIVNELNLTISPVNMSSIYDGEMTYTYYDGEIVDVLCLIDDITNDIAIKYYDKNDELLFSTDVDSYEKQLFRSRLKSNNDKYYILCSIKIYSDEYVYKLVFNQRKNFNNTELDSILVSVNGIRLYPLPTSRESRKKKYIYKFIPKDRLHLTCENLEKSPGPLLLHLSNNSPDADIGDPSGNLTIPLTSDYRNKTIYCTINKNIDTEVQAEILLTPDTEYFIPWITGLSEKNIEYRYKNNKKKNSVILYQYRKDEVLELTCFTRHIDSILRWDFDNHTETPEQNVDIIDKNIKGRFPLETRHNGSSIKCNKLNNINNIKYSVEIKLQYVAPELELRNHEEDGHLLLMILGLSVSVMFLTISCVFAICWYTRNKHAKDLQSSYENLTSTNDSPIPTFPRQWQNHYEDIEEDLNVHKPEQSRNNRRSDANANRYSTTPSESHYTEIDDDFKPKTYGINPKWSMTRPKSKINKDANINNEKSQSYDNLRHSNLKLNDDQDNSNNGARNRIHFSKASDSYKSVVDLKNNSEFNDIAPYEYSEPYGKLTLLDEPDEMFCTNDIYKQ